MHAYLVIIINYNTKGKVVLTMFDYMKNFFDESPEKFHGREETPAANHIFDVEK